MDKPLINTARKETQAILKNWVASQLYHQLKFVAVCELTTIASILVEQGIGYAIVIERSVAGDSDHLCFRPLTPTLMTSSFIIWKKYQSLSYTISRFIDFLLQKIREDKKEKL